MLAANFHQNLMPSRQISLSGGFPIAQLPVEQPLVPGLQWSPANQYIQNGSLNPMFLSAQQQQIMAMSGGALPLQSLPRQQSGASVSSVSSVSSADIASMYQFQLQQQAVAAAAAAAAGGSFVPLRSGNNANSASLFVSSSPMTTQQGMPMQYMQIPSPTGQVSVGQKRPASAMSDGQLLSNAAGLQFQAPSLSLNYLNPLQYQAAAAAAAAVGSAAGPKRRRKRRKASSCSSKFRGVSWHKRDRRWVARAWVNGKTENLGTFTSEKLAAIAVDERLILSYGPDADMLLNFSDAKLRESTKKEEEAAALTREDSVEGAPSPSSAASLQREESIESTEDCASVSTASQSCSPTLKPQNIKEKPSELSISKD